ncbi:MAG: hypothetical protein ABIA74_01680 [bacterium]
MKKVIFFTIISVFLSNFNICAMEIDPAKLLAEAQGISYKDAKKVNYDSFQKIYTACKKVAGDNSNFMKKIGDYKTKFDNLYKANKDERAEFGKMSVYLSLLYLEALDVVKKKDVAVFDKEIKTQPTITTDKLFSMGAGPLDVKQPADEAAAELGINDWETTVDKIKNESRS